MRYQCYYYYYIDGVRIVTTHCYQMRMLFICFYSPPPKLWVWHTDSEYNIFHIKRAKLLGLLSLWYPSDDDIVGWMSQWHLIEVFCHIFRGSMYVWVFHPTLPSTHMISPLAVSVSGPWPRAWRALCVAHPPPSTGAQRGSAQCGRTPPAGLRRHECKRACRPNSLCQNAGIADGIATNRHVMCSKT